MMSYGKSSHRVVSYGTLALSILILVGCPITDGVSVPDAVGMAQADAEAAITAAGLAVGIITQEYSDTVAEGLVISQSPAAGSEVNEGASVDITVSKGPEPEPGTVTVPNVAGMAQADAEAAITNAGLAVGHVDQSFSDTVAEGLIISQDPEAATTVNAGSAVDIEVSAGPRPVSVPNTVGRTQEDAETLLANAGLALGEVTQAFSDTVDIGRVISQDPEAGTNAAPGSEVDLVVSKGPSTVTVPDVLHVSQAEAEEDILDENLTVGTVSQAASDIIAAGYVISQDPEADSSADAESSVNIVVSSGLATEIEVPMAMVYVPGATFTMGDGSAGRPVHQVTLSPYYIGMYEVTIAEYLAVLNWALQMGYVTNSSDGTYTGGNVYGNGKLVLDMVTSVSDTGGARVEFEDGAFVAEVTYGFSRELHPITSVTWYGAVMFANWLSEWAGFTPAYGEDWNLVDAQEGVSGVQYTNGYRLQTEAEWEYAAAWEGTTRWTYGVRSDTLDTTRANFDDTNPLGIKGYPYTTIAGYYNGVNPGTVDSPSGAGCYDMAGNVREWCFDWLQSYTDDPVVDPHGPDGVYTYRVYRDGYWSISAEALDNFRTDERHGHYAGVYGSDIGFRITRAAS